ncbi:MAG: hypothetical protein AVDCRST_MAG04-1071 [uncultured Acetobacteraceae bacterium]|uniref:Uncharacterized protein n=1 Tax=uncultured Acetobacteraceae bacterium TaxID=169975 RepID=A0A6J4HPX0_9PROT|nr:MAG: hypothetical protein AVDCRST_MAG04-1071 [uncultured Acetobacteraceae bacterium]
MSPVGGLGGVAWTSPRFRSGDSPAAAEAEAPVGPEPDASASSRRKAESAPTPTRGLDATTRSTQASRSNIQAGTSRHRPASPARLHRNAVAFPLSAASWTWTERPLQGCHGYKSVRSVVLWAFSRRVVQRRTPARLARLQAARTRGVRASLRRAVVRVTPTLGVRANATLTSVANHPMGPISGVPEAFAELRHDLVARHSLGKGRRPGRRTEAGGELGRAEGDAAPAGVERRFAAEVLEGCARLGGRRVSGAQVVRVRQSAQRGTEACFGLADALLDLPRLTRTGQASESPVLPAPGLPDLPGLPGPQRRHPIRRTRPRRHFDHSPCHLPSSTKIVQPPGSARTAMPDRKRHCTIRPTPRERPSKRPKIRKRPARRRDAPRFRRAGSWRAASPAVSSSGRTPS